MFLLLVICPWMIKQLLTKESWNHKAFILLTFTHFQRGRMLFLKWIQKRKGSFSNRRWEERSCCHDFRSRGRRGLYDKGLVTECTLFYSLNRNSVFQTEMRRVSESSCTYSVCVDLCWHGYWDASPGICRLHLRCAILLSQEKTANYTNEVQGWHLLPAGQKSIVLNNNIAKLYACHCVNYTAGFQG